jgi:hypothetical protein
MHDDPKTKLARSSTWADIVATAIFIGIVVHIVLDRSSTTTLKIVDGAVAAATLAQLHFARLVRKASDELQQISDEKVAEANARAAEANRVAKQAELTLEKYKAPRLISAEHITAKMKGFSGIPFVFSVQTDPEPIGLMKQIGTALKAAGLVWQPWSSGVYGTPVFNQPGFPQAGIIAFSGIMIQIDDSKVPQWSAAVVALKDALCAEGVEADAKRMTDGSESPDAIHIYIGRKPQ